MIGSAHAAKARASRILEATADTFASQGPDEYQAVCRTLGAYLKTETPARDRQAGASCVPSPPRRIFVAKFAGTRTPDGRRSPRGKRVGNGAGRLVSWTRPRRGTRLRVENSSFTDHVGGLPRSLLPNFIAATVCRRGDGLPSRGASRLRPTFRVLPGAGRATSFASPGISHLREAWRVPRRRVRSEDGPRDGARENLAICEVCPQRVQFSTRLTPSPRISPRRAAARYPPVALHPLGRAPRRRSLTDHRGGPARWLQDSAPQRQDPSAPSRPRAHVSSAEPSITASPGASDFASSTYCIQPIRPGRPRSPSGTRGRQIINVADHYATAVSATGERGLCGIQGFRVPRLPSAEIPPADPLTTVASRQFPPVRSSRPYDTTPPAPELSSRSHLRSGDLY